MFRYEILASSRCPAAARCENSARHVGYPQSVHSSTHRVIHRLALAGFGVRAGSPLPASEATAASPDPSRHSGSLKDLPSPWSPYVSSYYSLTRYSVLSLSSGGVSVHAHAVVVQALTKFFSFSAETGLTTRKNPEKLLGRFGALETRLPETRRKRRTFSSYLGESVDRES